MPNTHRPLPRFIDALSTLSESASVLSSISPSLDERCFPTLLSATIRTASTVTGTAKHITASAIASARELVSNHRLSMVCTRDPGEHRKQVGYWSGLGETAVLYKLRRNREFALLYTHYINDTELTICT
jgi:hypothetical protein